MFRNYLLTALRNARRNKGVASINVFGLAASMAVCLLIVQIIRIQDSYEEFHEHGTRIYRVYSMFHNPVNAEPHLYGTSPARLAEYADEDLPGIESAIHVRTAFRGMALGDREPLYLRGMYADPDFFDMFSFALAEGNPATALSGPGKIVLSTETARRLFGTSDAVGRTVHLEDGTDLEITGIWAEAAYRTHIPISAVASMETLRQRNDPVFDRWPRGLARSFTFLRLSPGADRAQIEGQLNDLARNRFPDIGATTLEQLYIEPIGDMHLSSVSKDNDLNVNDSTILWFIGSLGIVVMAMAAFNYWSLTVARALRRSKEVGVRKTTGASRQALVAQFMVEALVSVAVAAAVAVGLLDLLVTGFNSLTGMSSVALPETLWSEPELYVSTLLFVSLVAAVAGVYPALHLSRFQAATAVKGGKLSWQAGGLGLRRVLTVVQFGISLIIVVTTAALSNHIDMMTSIEYGLRQEGLLKVRLHGVEYDVMRQDALGIPGVRQVAGSSVVPLGSRNDHWLAPVGGEVFKGYRYHVTEEFIEVLDLQLLAGRDLDPVRDESQSVIINEMAALRYGFETPEEAVGQTVQRGSDAENLRQDTVIGVVRDFQANHIDMADAAVVLARGDGLQFANILVTPGQEESTLTRLSEIWEGYGLMQPFEGETYAKHVEHTSGVREWTETKAIVQVVAALAVAIACLGLLGIAAYAAEARVKEVGIRKSIGATAQSLILLLSREQAVLIAVAIAISAPVAILFNDWWMSAWPNRAELSISSVAGPSLLLLGLAIATVASQTVRAAMSNPVDSLRYE